MGIVKDILYGVANKNFLKAFKSQTVFPYYHIVKDSKATHIENLYEYKNIAQFKSDIDLLLKNYEPIEPQNLFSVQKENSFLLTFDDGLEEVYSIIFPILKEKKIKAIFFINPDFVDNVQSLYKHDISIVISHLKNSGFDSGKVGEICKILGIGFATTADFVQQLKKINFKERHKVDQILQLLDIDRKQYLQTQKPYISKAQIQEMMDAGFYFGGHTMSHPPLEQLTFEEQKNEIINSIQWLKDNFGIKYSLFAFPFSDRGRSKKLINALFEYDKDLLVFGNSGLKKDIDPRIIQRFSLENPNKETAKQIVTENLYKHYNQLTGKYHIQRK